MGLDLTGTFSASLSWTQADSLTLNTVTDEGDVSYSLSYGSGMFQRIWSDSATLSSGSQVLIDLTALVRDVLEGTITTSLSQLRGIMIRNTSTTSGDMLGFGGAHSNRFTNMFSSGNAVIQIGPNGFLAFSSPLTGFNVVNNSQDIIRLSNIASGASGIRYEIAIVGVE